MSSTKPQKRKRSSSNNYTRNNKSSSVFSSMDISSSPKSLWKKSLHPKNQKLCKKVFPKNKDELVNTCIKYHHKGTDNDLYLKYKYGLKDITEESSPIFIFNENDNAEFSRIADGIHNFMLFWDDTKNKYTLVTAYFNAIEFGNKHNIISLRTVGQTPDTFIISGEIKKEKDNNTFYFHDISSQFFLDNPCNIKTQMPVIYLFELVDQKKFDVNHITPEQLEELKTDILSNNMFDIKVELKIKKASSFSSLVDTLNTNFITNQGDKLKIYDKYIAFITSIMTDAFNKIFKTHHSVLTAKYVVSFSKEDYAKHNQNNIDTILGKLCNQTIPLPLEVYPDGTSCHENMKLHKSEYNSCEMDKITNEYIESILPKKKSTPKRMETDNIKYSDIYVFINGNKKDDDDIAKIWGNWRMFKHKTMNGDEDLSSLIETITRRIQKKDSGSVVTVETIPI
jgi:hypothetical protein